MLKDRNIFDGTKKLLHANVKMFFTITIAGYFCCSGDGLSLLLSAHISVQVLGILFKLISF